MKRKLLYGMIIGIVLILPIVVYFVDAREVDEVKREVVKIGFDPLSPPNKALTLGSFYYVSLDGSQPRPVCSANAETVASMMETSPLEEVVASKLGNAHAKMQTELLRAVKAQAAVDNELNIQYSFRDTKLYQLNGANLVALEKQLFDETNCNAAIAEYINNIGLVCQIQSALMATVKYVVNRKDGHKLDSEDIDKIKSAIEVTTATRGMTVHESNVEGISLYYGVMFKPRCVTLDSEDAQIFYPQSRFDRFLLHTRLLWRRIFS